VGGHNTPALSAASLSAGMLAVRIWHMRIVPYEREDASMPTRNHAFAGNGPIEENKVWFTLFFRFFLPNPQPLAQIILLNCSIAKLLSLFPKLNLIK